MIFAAFQRRETYATSGPRITVRMYQTWDRTTNFCADPNFPAQLAAAERSVVAYDRQIHTPIRSSCSRTGHAPSCCIRRSRRESGTNHMRATTT